MTSIVIKKPNEIAHECLSQIIDLVGAGGQIEKEGLSKKLWQADLISYISIDGKVISTATLKNPFGSYRTRVFKEAKVALENGSYKELGYVCTHPDYEGEGYCKKLLSYLYKKIKSEPMYATTRKASMVHILRKYNFEIVGEIYKKDLQLMIHNGQR